MNFGLIKNASIEKGKMMRSSSKQ